MAPTDITDFAWFPAAAKDADHFKLFRIDKLAWRLRAHPKDLEFVDDSGAELRFEKLGDYILFIYQKYTAQRQPNKFKYFANGKYVTFDPSFRVVNRPATPQILMLFEENRNPGRQPWVFQRWCVGWDHVILAKSRSHTATHTTMRLNCPRQEPNFLRKEKEKTTTTSPKL
jgi:hypothetical protein